MNTVKTTKKYYLSIGYLLYFLFLIPFIGFGQGEDALFEDQLLQESSGHFFERNFQEAFTTLKKVVKEDHKNYELWFNLSYFALFASKPEEAIAAALKTKELNPAAVKVETNLALGYLLNNQWLKAEAIYLKWKGQIILEEDLSWERLFLRDIMDLESEGIKHTDFEKVKQMFVETSKLSIDKWLKRISPKSTVNLNSTQLDFSWKELGAVSKEIGKLQNLEYLNLSYDYLRELPAEIGQLQNLVELDLSYNDLTALPKEVGKLQNLMFLDLSSNQLTEVPAEIGQLQNLTRLHFDQNRLRALPVEIRQLQKLKSLKLGYNLIPEAKRQEIKEWLPNCKIEFGRSLNFRLEMEVAENFQKQNFQEAFSLQEKVVNKEPKNNKAWSKLSFYALYASKPKEAIAAALKTKELNPNAFHVDTNLALGYLLNNQWLKAETIYLKWKGQIFLEEDVSSKKGKAWDMVFLEDIADLEAVGITHTDFEKVKQMFNGSPMLRIIAWLKQVVPYSSINLNEKALRLGYNRLEELPAEIGQLQNLTGLWLDNNRLSVLPKEIGQLQSLRDLNLQDNQLTALPKEIGQLRNLTNLLLDLNQLTTLPKEIGLAKNLTRLELSFNEITALPREIGQLQNLRELSLQRNQLTALPKEIGQLQDLTKLYLNENQLKDLPVALVVEN